MNIDALRGNRVIIQELDNEEVTGDIGISQVWDIVLPNSIAQDKGKHMQARVVELGPDVEEDLQVGDRVFYERWRTRDLGEGMRVCFEDAIIAKIPNLEGDVV